LSERERELVPTGMARTRLNLVVTRKGAILRIGRRGRRNRVVSGSTKTNNNFDDRRRVLRKLVVSMMV
jgi:hypothetical protein